jgi:Zn-dependent protease
VSTFPLSILPYARSALLAQLGDPAVFLGLLLALIVGISVHEFSHAWMANRLGDPTARNQGRLTLNPISHFDLLGTVMIVLIGFGWGKPVPYNPARLRNGPISGGAMVAAAGPAANLVAAAAIGFILRNFVNSSDIVAGSMEASMLDALGIVVQINIALAIFNIIPIPPLDGYRILLRFLPPHIVPSVSWLELQGPFVLLIIVLLDQLFLRIGIFSAILGPPVRFFFNLFLGI